MRWLATAGVSLTGELPGDLAGSSVSLGDFDGDGFLDILVGAPGQSTAGHMAGAIYLVGSW